MNPDPDPGAGTDRLPHDQRRARRPLGAARLVRSRDRRIAGVAGGIAAFVGADPKLVRWLAALSVLPSFGITAAVYLVLWLLLPGANGGAD